jgi:hypothetical protein
MKNTLTLLTILIVSISAYSQDYIIKKNGDEKYCWIKEITEAKIKYADTTLADTTIKYINKSEVFMIRFRNGIKEVYGLNEVVRQEQVKPSGNISSQNSKILFVSNKEYIINAKKYNYKQVRSIMAELNDKEVNALLAKAKRHGTKGNIIGFCSIPFGIAAVACLSGYSDSGGYSSSSYGPPNYNSYDNNWLVGSGILAGVCASANTVHIVQKMKRAKCMRQAVTLYNSKILTAK